MCLENPRVLRGPEVDGGFHGKIICECKMFRCHVEWQYMFGWNDLATPWNDGMMEIAEGNNPQNSRTIEVSEHDFLRLMLVRQ